QLIKDRLRIELFVRSFSTQLCFTRRLTRTLIHVVFEGQLLLCMQQLLLNIERVSLHVDQCLSELHFRWRDWHW
ncbi:hypothetical protein PMAYCL1PPCAC_14545, partial [Pristionchus mayeri]